MLLKKEVFVLYCTCPRVDAGCLANLVVLVTLHVFNQDICFVESASYLLHNYARFYPDSLLVTALFALSAYVCVMC